MTNSDCTIDGCEKKILARGWCAAHYKRWRLYGDPLTVKDPQATPIGAAQKFFESLFELDTRECVIWPFARDRAGYPKITADGTIRNVGNAICRRLYGPPEGDQTDSAHSCGNGREGCVNPAHLRWATRAENMADSVRLRKMPRGERHHAAKLTDTAVRGIRTAIAKGQTDVAIAKQIGVTVTAIRLIRIGKTWAWLT